MPIFVRVTWIHVAKKGWSYENTATKKTTEGMTQGAPSAAKYRYSDLNLAADSTTTEIIFIKWPTSEDRDEEDGGNEEEEQVLPGSLKEILDGIANVRFKAVTEALGNKALCIGEARRITDEASKPFLHTMDEARQKFVDEGKLTEEEAKAILGVDDYTKKENSEARRHLQKALNIIQRERNIAVQTLVHEKEQDGAKVLTKSELQQQITEVSKPFEGGWISAESIMRNTDLGQQKRWRTGWNDEKDKDEDKDTENDVAAPPRVVTDEGFPVTKLGGKKFAKIHEEVDKRDQDVHGMYIYNDITGYGIKEVFQEMGHVEALTLYLRMGDHMQLMMNNDSEETGKLLDVLGIMYITAIEMLHEIGSIGTISPLPDNVGLLTLFSSTSCSMWRLTSNSTVYLKLFGLQRLMA
ncbi:hypothetical protein CJF31_00002958 [Rutstroemia sp. NJR-2017a BVV2]|nr:hypothetical protein CJF31_00002958 [Rutstroemia sp. NJR-2017a BVV2]